MIEQIYTYFTIETLYMWINLGILPFWFILIIFPQSHLSRIFVTSIFPFFILSSVYLFILYKSYLIGYDFGGNFTLYLGLNELSRLFEDHLYIMIFWTHFIAINLFIGGWIVKDSQKFSINKVLVAIPLITTYLIGYDFSGNFTLYLGLNELSRLFEDHLYLMIFWTHFIAINLFIGGWIVKDSQKFSINKVLLAIPLIFTYLIGPLGLFLYWIIKIFYAKRISLYE